MTLDEIKKLTSRIEADINEMINMLNVEGAYFEIESKIPNSEIDGYNYNVSVKLTRVMDEE